MGRQFADNNRRELFDLKDYRRRYALYRSDPDLQAVHAAAPMIAVWDDHEIANDSWQFGAQNHSEEEGDFEARKLAAIQAYFEWLPLRPILPDGNGTIYRSFDFGDLVSLHMLDTRLIGRDQQIEYRHFMDDSGDLDLRSILPKLKDPQRSMLGDAQRNWLQQRFSQSPGRWQVLGQQVLMARMEMPAEMLRGLFGGENGDTVALIRELAQLKDSMDSGKAIDEQQLARLRALLPYNLDAWDGYPAERERVYGAAKDTGRPLVVLAGDTHNAWYSRLNDADGRFIGVELATSSVSSPGMESYLKLDSAGARELARALPILIEELQWCELQSRGFLEVLFTRDAVESRWHLVDSVSRRDYRRVTHRERIGA